MQFNGTYLGKVEDINDPLKIGRCKIRIGFLFGEDITTENLPWAYPAYSISFGGGGQCGSVSIPKIGAIVRVHFENGNIYTPIYASLQELADDVKELLQQNYEGTHVILHDSDVDLQMHYTADTNGGLETTLKGSTIKIGNNTLITIATPDEQAITEYDKDSITNTANSEIMNTATNEIRNTSSVVWDKGEKVKLGSIPINSAVLGEPLFLLLSSMASIIDLKMSPSPGACTAMVEACKKFCLSNSVKVTP